MQRIGLVLPKLLVVGDFLNLAVLKHLAEIFPS